MTQELQRRWADILLSQTSRTAGSSDPAGAAGQLAQLLGLDCQIQTSSDPIGADPPESRLAQPGTWAACASRL